MDPKTMEMALCIGGAINLSDFMLGLSSTNISSSDSGAPMSGDFDNHTSYLHDDVTKIEHGTEMVIFDLLKMYIVPAICVFGLLGNILSLVILTRKRLKLSVDGTERTVHIGLTALAVSDLLFCICLLPHGLLPRDVFSHPGYTFQLLYVTYSGAFINTFILTSTWLTVTMAVQRYLAICHPFKARHLIGSRGTKTSVLTVFVTCLVFNVPRLMEWRIEHVKCRDGSATYFSRMSYLARGERAHTIFIWFYFTFGILIPLALLAFCNFCLVKALHNSSKLRKRCRVPAAHVDSNYRITAILVTIVVMYILLVSPSEIMLFVKDRFDMTQYSSFALAMEFTNVLQNINFSSNFVLYFVLNVHFRREFRDLICVIVRRCKGSEEKTMLKMTAIGSAANRNGTNYSATGTGRTVNTKVSMSGCHQSGKVLCTAT